MLRETVKKTVSGWKFRLSRRAVIVMAISILLVASLVVIWSVSASNTIIPIGIIVHHSALMPPIGRMGAMTRDRLPQDLESLDEFHRRRGFGVFYWGRFYHIGYHYLIFPDGRIEAGRPEHCVGAHARGFNNYLGIALIGDFSSKENPEGAIGPPRPTPEQMQSLVSLCRSLRIRYGLPLNRILRHNDVARTQCPGDRFPYREFLLSLQ